MSVVVVTPPEISEDLFTRAKLQLGLEDMTDDDALLRGALAGAVGFIDGPTGWLRRAVLPQTLRLEARAFHECFAAGSYDEILLPIPTVSAIVGVEYDDTAGAAQAYDPASYRLAGGWLVLNTGFSWPSLRAGPAAVRITYQSGYAEIPPAIVSALMLITADLYTNRESGGVGAVAFEYKMSSTVEALLWGFRAWEA